MANIVYDSLGRPSILNDESQSGLGYVPSNAGNVEDFNDPNSDLSRGTASLLQSMRMQREAKIKSDGMPESEKLFMIEMRRRKAKEDAINYFRERKLKNEEQKIQLNMIKNQQRIAEKMAEEETKRQKAQQDRQISLNDDYIKMLSETGQQHSPELQQQFLSIKNTGLDGGQPNIISQPHPEESTLQTPRETKPVTIGQKLSFAKKNKQDDELIKYNDKLEEKLAENGIRVPEDIANLTPSEKKSKMLDMMSKVEVKTSKTYGRDPEQWELEQWQKLEKSTNSLGQASRSALGQSGIANVRAARALEVLQNPNVTKDPYVYDLVNTDIQGIMKGAAPTEEQLKEKYTNLQYKLSSIWQKITANPDEVKQPEVRKQLINIIDGLRQVDNKVIDKHLGVVSVAYKKFLEKRPEQAKEFFDALNGTKDMFIDEGQTEGIHPQQAGNQSGTVKLQAPTGETMDVPSNQADHYISKGARRIK